MVWFCNASVYMLQLLTSTAVLGISVLAAASKAPVTRHETSCEGSCSDLGVHHEWLIADA